MPADNWRSLLNELEAISAEGEEYADAVSALAVGGALTRFWSAADVYGRVADWIARAYELAVKQGRSAFATNLDRLCEKYTEDDKRVSQIGDLRLRDFGRVDMDEVDDDGYGYVPPLDMRYRFQLFLGELLDETRQMTRTTQPRPLSPDEQRVMQALRDAGRPLRRDDLLIAAGLKPDRSDHAQIAADLVKDGFVKHEGRIGYYLADA